MKKFTKRIITPNDGHEYFFGYYDLQPYSTDNTKHLCGRTTFSDRQPVLGDIMEIGYIDIPNGKFVKVAETNTWNWQQGAFLTWFDQDESIIFNAFENGKYVSKVLDLNGNVLRVYDRPIATICRKANVAMSINFPRVYDFRPGYGYLNTKDEYYDVNAPEEDGIFIMDLKTGESKLLINYVEMKEAFKEDPFTDMKLVVNHITLTPNGTGFIFLLRNFPEEGKLWGTVLAYADINGNMRKLTNFEVNSHYSWKDEETLMIYSGLPKWGIYFFNVKTGERTMLNNPVLDFDDIHCNYSPDRKTMIGDGYPQPGESTRTLYFYDFETKKEDVLVTVYSRPVPETDMRCDLHARFSPDGSRISYDTTENVKREIAEILFID